ncbi:hypothetical protein GUITHDRAFT_160526 [Guillardia theta CCMP2712]|uniref:Uncharacterized protein n=2 Tax=Guillardia theta TaxID=55529 RepID=L1K2M0_GUITC|nr:hypothetical protein GUITHDRAFT_160526 [Guillardia theta CCMP2712]EKX54807.1 hypothetical protein GUITHDRAFT_160526 [Guillardia theta CCMP2712]|eukprot:XP_005841787.1 hypothetical protein GUITHDRAFT_160526 [Guillardia theta CCMP2712]
MSNDNLDGYQPDDGTVAEHDDKPAESKEGMEPEGFHSGLGLRKTLRHHLDNAMKFWDHSVHDLVNKLHQNKEMNVAQKAHAVDLEPGDGVKQDAMPGDSPASAESGHDSAHGGETDPSPEVHLAGVPQREEHAVDEELDPPPVPPSSNPWSPISRPISMALDAGKQMGRRLADVWDVHDILDDLKEQRDYWRRKREQNRLMEEMSLNTVMENQGGASEKDQEAQGVDNQVDFFDFLIKLDRDITERPPPAQESSGVEKEEAPTTSCTPGDGKGGSLQVEI